jgi:hypothetical protein
MEFNPINIISVLVYFIGLFIFITISIFIIRRSKKKLQSAEISRVTRNKHRFGLVTGYVLLIWGIFMTIISIVEGLISNH